MNLFCVFGFVFSMAYRWAMAPQMYATGVLHQTNPAFSRKNKKRNIEAYKGHKNPKRINSFFDLSTGLKMPQYADYLMNSVFF
jgi:hypothetical protein